MLPTSEILKVLPHKHPYLLVDRIEQIEPGEKVVGVKAVTFSEPVFQGHYPDDPICPGALIIESASQVAGFLVSYQKNMIGYVIGVNQFLFKKQVSPGCLLKIEATKKNKKGPFLDADIVIKVGDELIASGSLQLYIRERTF